MTRGNPTTSSETSPPSPAPKKRVPHVTLGQAAVKVVKALATHRTGDALRLAPALAKALEREGDPGAAAAIRTALSAAPSFQARPLHALDSPEGEWCLPDVVLDPLILNLGGASQAFERLEAEIAASPLFVAAGIDAPTRIFFEGPSGTGKTLAARHLAQRLGLPLLLGRLDELIGAHLGETAKLIAKLMKVADSAPCVLFLDELDGLVGVRNDKSSAAAAEMSRATSSLLQQLDALPREQIVIAASNFPSELDSALYRSFPVRMAFGLPDWYARTQMLTAWWKDLPLPDLEREICKHATNTDSMSGADLRARAMQVARTYLLQQQEAGAAPASAAAPPSSSTAQKES